MHRQRSNLDYCDIAHRSENRVHGLHSRQYRTGVCHGVLTISIGRLILNYLISKKHARLSLSPCHTCCPDHSPIVSPLFHVLIWWILQSITLCWDWQKHTFHLQSISKGRYMVWETRLQCNKQLIIQEQASLLQANQ